MSTTFESIEGFNAGVALESLEVDLMCSGQQPREYMDYLEEHYVETEAFGVLSVYAQYFGYQDLLDGKHSPERPEPFFKGALLGLRAVELSPASWVVNELGGATFEVGLPRDLNEYEDGDENAKALIRDTVQSLELKGSDGYSLVVDFHDAIHIWGAHITGSMPAGIPFQCGLGYALRSAKQLVDQRAAQNFAKFLEDSGLDVAAIEADFE